jgi:IS1 family transposase
VKAYFTDHWEACVELVPKTLLVQTKAKTHGVEQDNFRQRHGLHGSAEKPVLFPIHYKWLT